jgi:hypothetical protein
MLRPNRLNIELCLVEGQAYTLPEASKCDQFFFFLLLLSSSLILLVRLVTPLGNQQPTSEAT